MPALVRTELNTTAKNTTTEKQSARKGSVITEISVTARIDYILRFSKQAVLVVAEQTEQYSTIAQQFLVTLSNGVANEINNQPSNHQCNVAFVSASIKLNDIQIRCRLIEQLFGNALFDPEQSLAVSILRLAKQQGEAITIIVEHAHALSLQVKYELSQLVAIAKKNNQEINVVMFAQTTAAEDIHHNSSLFKNKLAIIDAISGQLYSSKNTKHANKSKVKWLKLWHKIMITIGLILMLLISGSLYFYLQTEQGAEYLKPSVMMESKNGIIKSQLTTSDNRTAKVDTFISEVGINTSINFDKKELPAANVREIYSALVNPYVNAISNNKSIPAKADDVLSALLLQEEFSGQVSSSEDSNLNASDPQPIKSLGTDYYLAISGESQGVVIQIAGFSDSKHLQQFLDLYPQQEFYSYQKRLSDSALTIVTSKVYPDRSTARAAMQNLPKAVTERQLWLKPISTVITEINTFKG